MIDNAICRAAETIAAQEFVASIKRVRLAARLFWVILRKKSVADESF
jgi:hypothetical protein